jgi:hypothetical protein
VPDLDRRSVRFAPEVEVGFVTGADGQRSLGGDAPPSKPGWDVEANGLFGRHPSRSSWATMRDL